MSDTALKNSQIVKEIEDICDFELKYLSLSTVFKDVDNSYSILDIWENRDNALKVLVDLKYNGYTLVPF